MTGVFLQNEADEDEEPIIIELTGVVDLLLEETDKKWKKHLRGENGKWVACATCNKIVHGSMNTTLIAHKKLARSLK